MTQSAKDRKKLRWWQLSLLGVACTIGTGFFLGSHLAIEIGGPAVLAAYVIAAIAAYLVFNHLARMTAKDPMEGSFRSYAKAAYGRWAGFSSGWVYWSSELLITGSQLTALSLFSRFWFPAIPMWCFAIGYGALGLLIVILGTKSFERWENGFALMKIAAIAIFIVLALLALFGVFKSAAQGPAMPTNWLPSGWTGLWAALIFAFYGYGGLEVMGLMAMRLKKPDEAPKAGRIMLLLLGTVYVVSIGLTLLLEPWTSYRAKESPFIVALADYKLTFVPHLFNGILIIAGFSTMTASLFAVTTMLVTLAKDGDAPPLFAKNRGDERRKPWAALALTASGLAASIVFALLLPERVYEYVTTAAGLMLLYNWLFILATAGRLLKMSFWGQAKRLSGMALIALAVAGTCFHAISRPGFFISLGFSAIIGSVTSLLEEAAASWVI
ncbi:amino acid permease [Cohnella lubricantis]|uniref:Amino acid permease n=1 Tax=Cohnella lubricantis TaxID=2163172 RepID=A0A841TEY5_9BACL|nr:amino acid permease [Cohnella lubricantis]MBB6677858.1 amino acid permease [Cohnella lubricantis]MBP2119037.1 L-asparagine transporter-like permease [Cohnella lubricantis]